MGKQAVSALAGLLGLCVSVLAQEIRDFGSIQPAGEQADFFGKLTNASKGPAPLQLADGKTFSFSRAFAWMAVPPACYIPALPLAAPPRLFSMTPVASNCPDSPVSLVPRFDYAGAEVGAFYGKSSGKFGREVYGGYILGEVIDGNTHINVGASYEHANGRVSGLIPH